MSKEMKAKISKSMKGHTPWNKGLKYPEEVKRIMRASAKKLNK